MNSDRLFVEMAVRLMSRVRQNTAKASQIGQLIQCLAKTGLSPAYRNRVSAVPQPTEEDSGWDELFQE